VAEREIGTLRPASPQDVWVAQAPLVSGAALLSAAVFGAVAEVAGTGEAGLFRLNNVLNFMLYDLSVPTPSYSETLGDQSSKTLRARTKQFSDPKSKNHNVDLLEGSLNARIIVNVG
jgi:hypothetical protein